MTVDIDPPAVEPGVEAHDRIADDSATLVQLLTARARSQPDATRFVFLGDGEHLTASLTYAEVDTTARAIAARLLSMSNPGDRALLLYAPGLEFITAFYGCLYAGVIAVPVAPPQINKLETSLARLAAIRENCGAELMLTSVDIEAQLDPVLTGVAAFVGLETFSTDTVDDDPARTVGLPEISPDTVAYLQYSSGSTGRPKGIVLTHRNVLSNNALVRECVGIDATSVGVSWLPTYHDMGLLAMVTQPVFSDYQIVAMSPLAFVQRPMRWIAALAEYKATITVAPNFAYALAVQRVPVERVAEFDLSQLKVALCGAEPIRAQAMAEFSRHFMPAGLDARSLFPCYGLAEATLFVSGGPVGSGVTVQTADPEQLAQHRFAPAIDGREIVSSGQINDGFTLAIIDPKTRESLPDGRIGEICIAGDSIGLGYWQAAELSAEVFDVQLPELDGGFLRTGDLGFVLDEQLYVTGRRKDLIIVDGHNHYPTDLEATAMTSHSAVRLDRCAVFQVDSIPAGGIVVVAEIDRGWRIRETADTTSADTNDVGQAVPAAEVVRAVRAAVGERHGLPVSDVVLVGAGTLPLTSSGKLQRFAVRETYAGGGFTTLGS
ncbi:fatty acyl-AMP ligase [Nocardia sp. NPDC057663]|uniref:fatty acyl-AMP ligase n=1 Tax=Nocardia sp. NPDC057663 TaxID=3346201 RepID=UPI003671692F